MERTFSLLIGLGAVVAILAGLAFLMVGSIVGVGLLGLALVLLVTGGVGLGFTNE